MKAEKALESPKSDDSLSQKEDLLERRRLQNRLSQRNHRRKIRDRIAKLQERVIANELRASAALNGWDQQYEPSPLHSNRHLPHSYFNISPRDHLNAGPSTQSSQPYKPANTWSRDMGLHSSPGLMGVQACCVDGGFPTGTMGTSPPVSDWSGNASIQPLGGPREDMFQDTFTTGESVPTETPNNLNPPLYYVATETALPQIIQVLSTILPQSKIIVLVPPDSTTAAAAGYPSPAPTLGNGLDSLSPPQVNAAPTCQYQTQMAPKTWSAPGPYVPGCPSHKMQSTPSGGFPGMRL